jgi:hypothetical protein
MRAVSLVVQEARVGAGLRAASRRRVDSTPCAASPSAGTSAAYESQVRGHRSGAHGDAVGEAAAARCSR